MCLAPIPMYSQQVCDVGPYHNLVVQLHLRAFFIVHVNFWTTIYPIRKRFNSPSLSALALAWSRALIITSINSSLFCSAQEILYSTV